MTCRGKGVKHGVVKEQVKIPAGVDNGVNLRVKKKGHASESSQESGDLLVNLKILPHKEFKRQGVNIYSDLYISIG